MRCLLGEEQRMHINYMQSKISVIRAIRVQKKRIYMRCLLGKEQQISLYFSEHESHSNLKTVQRKTMPIVRNDIICNKISTYAMK